MDIKKIKNFFTFKIINNTQYDSFLQNKVSILKNKVQIDELFKDIERLNNIVKRYEEEENIREEILITSIGDPQIDPPSLEPTEIGPRKSYVAKVARFHKEVLSFKLREMISKSHILLEQTGNQEDYDKMLKGVIFALREMLVWGSRISNEYIADVVENSEDIKVKEENNN